MMGTGLNWDLETGRYSPMTIHPAAICVPVSQSAGTGTCQNPLIRERRCKKPIRYCVSRSAFVKVG